MNTEFIANIIGFFAAGVGIITFLPQVVQCWRTKNTKAVSFLTYSLLAFVSMLWTTYGILLNQTPIILVNSTVFVLSVFVLVLKRKYG